MFVRRRVVGTAIAVGMLVLASSAVSPRASSAQVTPSPMPAAPPAPAANAPARPGPAAPDAATALEHARAAYEYGEIDEVVEAARSVAEGRLSATPAERAQALRYLGIGLFLTRRAEGAETAFLELLRLRPDARLDPHTTRPDVVAFFEQVRRRHQHEIDEAARTNNPKTFAWNFLPPVGQFQNGHRGRGYVIAALEVVTLATAITTLGLLTSWEQPHHVFDDPGTARAVRAINWGAIAAFGLTYVYGVVDGIAHYGDRNNTDDEEETRRSEPGRPTARLSILPNGFALTF